MLVDGHRKQPYKGNVLTATRGLGEQLKGWREAAGLRQDELAAILGITQQTVSDWERGKARPHVSRASALETALRLDAQTVLLAIYDADTVADGNLGRVVGVKQEAPPVEVAALSGKWDRLSEKERRQVLRLIDEMLEEE